MLASAQSQITAEYKSLNSAINATGLTSASSSSTISQKVDGSNQMNENNNSLASASASKKSTNTASTSVASSSGYGSGASITSQAFQQQQQQQLQNSSLKNFQTEQTNPQHQQQPLPQPKPKQQPQPPSQQTQPQQTPRRRSQSSNLGEITQSLDINSSKNAPTIDPLQYNALMETNEALKSELQRLSVFELKCKSLEKVVCFLFFSN